MGRTALGTLLVGAAVLCFVVAIIRGTLAPALVGLAVLAYTEGARRSAKSTRLSAKRVLPKRTAIGDHVRARLTVEAEDDLPLEVADEVPDAFAVISRRGPIGRKVAQEELVLRPREPGTAQFERVTVRVADPWGLHDKARTIPLVSAVSIAPEPAWAAAGKRVGRRHRVTTGVRRRVATDPSPEIATVREWQPGDRSRDIDWAHSSVLGKLMTRERERTAPRPVQIIMDATPAMRLRRRIAKITTTARLAYGVSTAAKAAGVHPSFVAFTEDKTVGAESPGHRRRIEDVLESLVKLPAPTGTVDPEPLRLPEAAAFTRVEGKSADADANRREVLSPTLTRAVASLTGRTTSIAFIVAILDAEAQPRAAEVAVRRLLHKGHRVVLVTPALGAHHFRRGEATGQVLRDLVRARQHRERLRRRLAGYHVPVISLRPDNTSQVLEEVARWAQ